MITCERCGKEIPDNLAICPNCGTVSSTVKDMPQPPTKHGPYSGRYIDTPPEQAYPPRQDYPGYQPPLTEHRSQQQYHGYGQPYNTPPMYHQTNINVTMVNTNNSTPLIVELLLSIFLGIYGVGWLMAGETTVGIVLIACSLVIYLPLFILSVIVAIFTFGLSLFCTGPIVIGAIVLNAILLNNRLKRKAVPFIVPPPR